VARLRNEATSWGNIPLALNKRREFLRDDRLWELFRDCLEYEHIPNDPELSGQRARANAIKVLAAFDRDSRTITEQPTPPNAPDPLCLCGHNQSAHNTGSNTHCLATCRCEFFETPEMNRARIASRPGPIRARPAEPEWLTELEAAWGAIAPVTERGWVRMQAAIAAAREACK
jgi:hypothetical protein